MITKEQWAEIEKTFLGWFAGTRFKLGKDEIQVAREAYKEGERRLMVYLNGQIKYKYCYGGEEDEYKALVEKFWHKETRAYYKPKEKKACEKIFGGKKRPGNGFRN
jgi:hypothetical protein